MTIPGRVGLRHIATGCVRLAGRQFGRHPGWSLASPDEPGAVCADLPADGPLTTRRLDLRQQLARADTGQVPARVDGWQRVTHEQGPRLVRSPGQRMTAFPFAITHKTLRGEPYKSLASLALSRHLIDLPGEFTWQVETPPGESPVSGGAPLPRLCSLLVRLIDQHNGAVSAAQAAYDGHPLCTYAGDGSPGQANGYDLNGGFWYEVHVSG